MDPGGPGFWELRLPDLETPLYNLEAAMYNLLKAEVYNLRAKQWILGD